MGFFEFLHHALTQRRAQTPQPLLFLIERIIATRQAERPTGRRKVVVGIAQVFEVHTLTLLHQPNITARDQLTNEFLELRLSLEQLAERTGESRPSALARLAPFVGLGMRSRNQRSK